VSSEAGALELLARVVAESLSPLKDRLQAGNAAALLEDLGLRTPDGFLAAGGVGGAVTNGASAALQLSNSLPPLVTAIDSARGDDTASIITLIARGGDTTSKIVALVAAIRNLATAIDAGAAALPPAQRATVSAFAAQLPSRLLEYLLLANLDARSALVVPTLAAIGLADDAPDPGDVDDPLTMPHRARRLHLDAIAKLAQDPAGYFGALYGWGTPAFDGTALLARVANILAAAQLPASLLRPPGQPAVLEALLLRATVNPDPGDPAAPPGVWIRTRRPATVDVVTTTPLGGVWSFVVDAKARYDVGLEAGFFPSGRLVLQPPTGTADADVSAGFRAARADGQPMTLLGLAGATRLEVKAVEATAGVRASFAMPPGRAEAEPTFAVRFDQLTCVLDVGGGDSFLKSMSGGGRGRSDVSIGAQWSPKTGLKFTGSGTVEIAIPAHARIGPATIETIYIVSGFKDGTIPIELSASVRGELGPFKASVDRIGVELITSFPAAGGNLGPAQLDARFKPPRGVGLSISGGGITGGGFLYLDADKGEYAGGLELQFQEFIHIKAIGLLNTKMPDGSQGFSLLVIITAEFVPIQLGFGFTLIGVGGLLGVNRTVLYEDLRTGVRDGSLNSILFPTDIVANAPRIISDLKRIFPPLNGRFLIGPMGKLGWGTPALITLEIGVILEIPRPAFAILGVLRMALPADDVAILHLQVNFLGIVDFEQKQLSFDASLFDSRVLTFTLTGDMAVRLYWGENANFLMTVGGFHPAYTPPPMGLGPLARLAIVIFQGNPSLRAEAYFAVTSNTVQFGARVELKAGADIFNVYGFIGLDALIQFDPFQFVIQIGAMVAVRSGTSTLFSIRLDLTLEGPKPWHAYGRGSFEIGFIFTISISVSFDVTFGADDNPVLPPIRVTPLIEEALRADGNWRVFSEGHLRQHVSVRALPANAGVVIPPMGVLGVTQKIAPLGLALARFGSRHVDGSARFAIGNVTVGGVPAATTPAIDLFAPAQFLELSDAEKLSRRSYEPFAAGIEVNGANAPKADFQRGVDVVYEVIYFRKPRRRLLFQLGTALVELYTAVSAAARSRFGATRRAPTGLGTPKVTVPHETFVVAGVADLKAHAPDLVFSSEAAAAVAMRDLVAKDATLTGKLQVVGSYEVAA
jgi:hypothetical protein